MSPANSRLQTRAANFAAALCLLLAAGCGPSAPKTRLVNHAQSVANGQIQVTAGQSVHYTISVMPNMQNAAVKGSFSATGGSGNDIVAAIADETNYANWVNGHSAQVLWQTSGQQTAGNFSVALMPGTYNFGVSNKFSALSDKQVTLNVELDYTQEEPVQ